MDPTRARVNYLRTWLERHKGASDVAPSVQEALDEAEWELGVIRDRPLDAANLSTTRIDEYSGMALRRVTDALPMLPDYDLSASLRINSISTSSSSAAFTYVHEVGMIGTPAAVEYSLAKADQYRVLQESHQRRSRVRGLIQELVPRATVRFEAACLAVDQSRIGVSAKSAAASELRNLVDGVQGELIELARRTPREQFNWETMSERLAPTSSDMQAVLLEQGRLRSTLYADLSYATKLREGERAQPIENLLARALNHVFAVLSAIKAGKAA
ncbi:MAG: hypothetical protein AB7N29_18565 [Vicinamibacterales bacterium]